MTTEELLKKKEEMIEVMRNLLYTEYSIKTFSYRIGIYIHFLSHNGEAPNYDSANVFIKEYSQQNGKDEDSYFVNSYRYSIFKFIYFLENGYVTKKIPTRIFDFSGFMNESIENYLDFLTNQKKLAKSTLYDYKHTLEDFNKFFKIKKATSINDSLINDYFIFMKDNGKSIHLMYIAATVLKHYFKYIHERNYIDIDYSNSVPKIKYIRNWNLPSVFTTNEIKKIVEGIDRNSDVGKRDYAMIILALRYGLRSSDIVSLTFDEIDWDNNKLKINQVKTKRMVELPLLPEVGNAIIDYLKNSRRESDLPFVFQPAKGPLKILSTTAFYNILNKYIKKANIENIDSRHHGPHSLRHSLANELLKNGDTLPDISGILGHSSTEVTKVYLSIDYNSLKKCALPMPALNSRLYNKEL